MRAPDIAVGPLYTCSEARDREHALGGLEIGHEYVRGDGRGGGMCEGEVVDGVEEG